MSSSPTEGLVDVVLPAMGTSISEGTVIGWFKAVGDAVGLDEPICEVSTDKIDTECPSPATGELAEILVDVGETVEVGTVIARLVTERTAVPLVSADREPEGAASAGASAAVANGASSASRRLRSSPVARRMAEAHGVQLPELAGTGAGGRVTKKDVLAHLERASSPSSPTLPAVTTDFGGSPEPLSAMRRSIGAAMRRSQETAATCHTVVECDMSRVEGRRRELGLTALPLVARAAVETLRHFPELNATLDGTTIVRYQRVHLGIAVSLGADGLIVPVIHDAQDLSPTGLGGRIKELARRARSKQLLPDDVQGATFTITNPGAAGALIATPIINVPQVAILDLEAIVRRPVVLTDAAGNESIAIRPMANLILGWDHRAVDGVYAAQFLTALRKRLEGRQPIGSG